MPERSTLSGPKQLDEAVKLAQAAGLTRAADLISEFRAKRYPVRDWEFGACMWCKIFDGALREATWPSDLGGGPPTCERHGDPDFVTPPVAEWAEKPSEAELAEWDAEHQELVAAGLVEPEVIA
jgi:hypothetical protein